jgi:hypothetical protein
MATPIQVDIFNRFMIEGFDEKQIIPVETVGQTFFAGGRTWYSPDANVVDIDIMRANRRTAALIPRGTISEPLGGHSDMATQRFSSFSRKYPLSQEQSNISADQIQNRLMGQNAYSGKTRVDALRELALECHYENIRRHVRLFERLAWTSLLTGKMPAILGTTNTDLIYDYRRNTNLTITPSHGWGNAAGYPFTDLDLACDRIRQYGKTRAKGVFLGATAWQYFLQNAQVNALYLNRPFLDQTRMGPGNNYPPWAMKMEAAGAIILGKIKTPGGRDLVLLTYDATYLNEAGTDTKYMPDDEAFVFDPEARTDRYFGPPDMLPMVPQRAQWYQETFGFNPMGAPQPVNIKGEVISPAMFYVDAFPNENQTVVTLRTQAAPIFVPTQTDAFCEIKAVGNAS